MRRALLKLIIKITLTKYYNEDLIDGKLTNEISLLVYKKFMSWEKKYTETDVQKFTQKVIIYKLAKENKKLKSMIAKW